VLKEYGLPDVNVVKSLYETFPVKLSVGEAGDVHIPLNSNLSPTWFIVFMQAVKDATQKKWKCILRKEGRRHR
jgi:hypothetical protein